MNRHTLLPRSSQLLTTGVSLATFINGGVIFHTQRTRRIVAKHRAVGTNTWWSAAKPLAAAGLTGAALASALCFVRPSAVTVVPGPEVVQVALLDGDVDHVERFVGDGIWEPACGDGNFLVQILRRKLAAVPLRAMGGPKWLWEPWPEHLRTGPDATFESFAGLAGLAHVPDAAADVAGPPDTPDVAGSPDVAGPEAPGGRR